MARQRTQYKLVGRYMRGNDTVYYGVISENGEEKRYTEEQLAFMVGRGQIINITAQLYNDKVLFRGINCDIKNLPVIQLCDEPALQHRSITDKISTRNTKYVTMTEELYNRICNDKNIHILNDYKFSCAYDKTNNTMSIHEQFVPSYGEDLTQLFFDDEEQEKEFIITDDNVYFYLKYSDSNEVIAQTNDKILILNILNIVSNKIKSVKALDKSADFIKFAFSSFCGSLQCETIASEMRANKYPEFDFTTSTNLLIACIIEMKYSFKESVKEPETIYDGYLFRGQKEHVDSIQDESFKSTTTSIGVAKDYARNGIILAIKNIRLKDIINVQTIAGYDKDFIYYEHELLIRDLNIIHIENQIGVFKNIPIYSARLEMPQCDNRVKHIFNQFIKAYGNNTQFNTAKLVLKCLKTLQNIRFTSSGVILTKRSGESLYVEFTDDANTVIINDNTYNNITEIQKIII